jgi:hypothetical protein
VKTKNLKTTLTLKKETISNLDNMEMGVIKGGTAGAADSDSCYKSACMSCYICLMTINYNCPPTH